MNTININNPLILTLLATTTSIIVTLTAYTIFSRPNYNRKKATQTTTTTTITVVNPREIIQKVNLLRTPADYERAFHAKASPLAIAYYSYTCGDGETLREAREAFHRLKLVPRSMTATIASSKTSYFGKDVSIPLIIGPTAMHNLAHVDGEIATARGCGKAGGVYIYNYFLSSKPIEQVVKEPGVKWLHVYLFEERDAVEFAVEEALDKYQGVFSAVVVTCDHPHNRVRDTVVPLFQELGRVMTSEEFGMAPPSSSKEPHFPNLQRACAWERMRTSEDIWTSPDEAKSLKGTNDERLTWNDLSWLKSRIRGRVPLVAKGILHPDDALLAVSNGADAIVVSNHGGRQVDGSVAAIEALPRIVTTLGGGGTGKQTSVPIFLDTGVRTSADVIRALGLGAVGVLIGRPPLFALSVNGAEGVEHLLKQWGEDIRDDMKCLGWKSFAEPPPRGMFWVG
jgi:isopentenyl diphosphate isomerase/L-lactate dehydrogenase-like FMN-dependent dehydrogenase